VAVVLAVLELTKTVIQASPLAFTNFTAMAAVLVVATTLRKDSMVAPVVVAQV